MRTVIDSLVRDALDRVSQPEVRTTLQTTILAPLLNYLLDVLSPYLFAIVGLWVAMFLMCMATLVVVLRQRGIQ